MSSHEALSGMTLEQQKKMLRELLEARAANGKAFPLSIQQRSLWYEHQRDPTRPAYNVYFGYRIHSPIELDAYCRTIECLVERHESLRTTFGTRDGMVFQQVRASLPPEIRVVDAANQSETAIRELAASESMRPFDLENGPLLRLKLFRKAADDWFVVASTHHIAVDYWSLVLILGDTRHLYQNLIAGNEPSLPSRSNNYASFVGRQQHLLRNPEGEKLRRYWRKQLRDTSFITEFPTDFVRPSRFTGKAAAEPIEFTRNQIERISALAREQGVTIPSILLAILQTFVFRYTGERRFLIGCPFSGRLRREYEETVGFFVNMLPLRAEITPEITFVDLVRQASGTFAKALQHEALPLAEIMRDANLPSDPSRSPFFQISFTFEKSHRKKEEAFSGYLISHQTESSRLADLIHEPFPIPVQACHSDLEFIFEQNEQSLKALLCYAKDLFDVSSIRAFIGNLGILTEQLLTHPTRPIADLAWNDMVKRNHDSTNRYAGEVREQETINAGGELKAVSNPTATEQILSQTPVCASGLLTEIWAIAAASPQRTAVSSRDYKKTYAELTVEAELIATALVARAIGPGCFVPVAGRSGPRILSAILGVMATGAAVVPIDSDEPAVSPTELSSDTAPRLVILEDNGQWPQIEKGLPKAVEVRTIEQLLNESPKSDYVLPVMKSDDLCYLIYTSGSSGHPKGVMIENLAIYNTMKWRAKTVPVDGNDRVLVMLSHQFDAGFGLMLSCLHQGATLVWPKSESANIDSLLDHIAEEGITVLPSIPSLLTLMVDHPRFHHCKSIRQVWTGGESMPVDLPKRLRARGGLTLWNFYGPTEAAIESAAAEVIQHECNRIVPIGKPIDHTELLVVDQNLREVPVTVPGELAIRGPGLARGYLGQPELTARRFRRLSKGDRVFLTGDRGRKRTDGLFEYLGRLDDQVKVGGYRIELQEIETVLQTLPLVREAAVTVRESTGGSVILVAYIHATPEQGTNEAQLRDQIKRALENRLPPYKRPRHINLVDVLPKTSSGKIDRKRLPEITDQQLSLRDLIAPRNALEQFLTQRWAEMLGMQEVGIKDNFFELGGSSLQAAMLATQLSDQLKVHVPTSLLFDMPDVLRVSQRLASLHQEALANQFGWDAVDEKWYSSESDLWTSNRLGSTSLIEWFGAAARENANNEPHQRLTGTPIFMIHPPGGIVACYRELAKRAPENQTFCSIRARGLDGGEELPPTAQAMAMDYVEAIRATVPHGPYRIGGWSLGGIAAWEVARQLIASGESVEKIILLDTSIPDRSDPQDSQNSGLEYGLDLSLEQLSALEPGEQLPLLWEHAKNLGVLDDQTPQAIVQQTIQDLRFLFQHHLQVLSDYQVQALDIPVLLIRPREVPVAVDISKDRGWSAFSPHVEVEFVAGYHHSMIKPPGVDEIAKFVF